MGLFDYLSHLFEKNQTIIYNTSPIPEKKKESSKESNIPREVNSPSPSKESNIPREVNSPSPSKELSQKNEEVIKITDTKKIINDLRISKEKKSIDNKIAFLCPIRNAKIFCKSILIDKLGDLTKFIILSLYHNHSYEEISDITQMGELTLGEEIKYLIRGGILNNDEHFSLTELGKQYGRLLELFDSFSDGIPVLYNAFANIFEPITNDLDIRQNDKAYKLPVNYIHVLSRNDNYSNSLTIALEHLEIDSPFIYEIRKSLYTTVEIDKRDSQKYKQVFLSDINYGVQTEHELFVGVAIPYYKISYKIRYSVLNPYRDILKEIEDISDDYPELLSEKAEKLISANNEEKSVAPLNIYINAITGKGTTDNPILCDAPTGKSIIVLDDNILSFKIYLKEIKELFLDEIKRDILYQIRYFSYNQMEEQQR